MSDDGGSAFPEIFTDYQGSYPDTYSAGGMTLRDHFAGKALGNMELKSDGRYSKDDRDRGIPEKEAEWIATAAYRYADAMLKARKARTP